MLKEGLLGFGGKWEFHPSVYVPMCAAARKDYVRYFDIYDQNTNTFSQIHAPEYDIVQPNPAILTSLYTKNIKSVYNPTNKKIFVAQIYIASTYPVYPYYLRYYMIDCEKKSIEHYDQVLLENGVSVTDFSCNSSYNGITGIYTFIYKNTSNICICQYNTNTFTFQRYDILESVINSAINVTAPTPFVWTTDDNIITFGGRSSANGNMSVFRITVNPNSNAYTYIDSITLPTNNNVNAGYAFVGPHPYDENKSKYAALCMRDPAQSTSSTNKMMIIDAGEIVDGTVTAAQATLYTTPSYFRITTPTLTKNSNLHWNLANSATGDISNTMYLLTYSSGTYTFSSYITDLGSNRNDTIFYSTSADNSKFLACCHDDSRTNFTMIDNTTSTFFYTSESFSSNDIATELKNVYGVNNFWYVPAGSGYSTSTTLVKVLNDASYVNITLPARTSDYVVYQNILQVSW